MVTLTGIFRAFGTPIIAATPSSDHILDEHSTTVGEDQHPAFKELAFWHAQGVLGMNTVVHHA